MNAYDLHVQEESRDTNTFKELCTVARNLGYSGLAVEMNNAHYTIPSDIPLSILQRVTFSPKSATRLRMVAKKQRKQVDLFAVHGRTKPISLAAAIVPSVDLVMLRDLSDFSAFDSQVARALAKHEKPVEVCLRGLMIQSGADRSRLMRGMASAMSCLSHANCELILTSGATTCYGIRSPRDLAALSYLANVSEDLALKGIFANPKALVERLLKTQMSKV
jgi:ribonuclease P/MRP protein subunit RPP1